MPDDWLKIIGPYIAVFSGGIILGRMLLGFWRQQKCMEVKQANEGLLKVIESKDKAMKATLELIELEARKDVDLRAAFKDLQKEHWRAMAQYDSPDSGRPRL